MSKSFVELSKYTMRLVVFALVYYERDLTLLDTRKECAPRQAAED